MDFNGIFMVTAGTGIKNVDSVFIEQFSVYNPEEKVAVGHNQHFHDAHKRKA